MNYENFICGHSEKKVHVSKVYKIADQDSEEHVILVNNACPHVNCSDCEACQNCYGTVSHSIQKVKSKKGAARTQKVTRIDRFIEAKDSIINILEATVFIDEAEILDVLSTQPNLMGGSTNNPWIAYDRPNTWKNTCNICSAKYSNNNELTPCQKATKSYNDIGINLTIATERQIVEHELPNECLCKEAEQRIVYVY